MPPVSLLEGVGCKAHILLLRVGPGDGRPVDQVLRGAPAWEGALGFVLAITSWWGVSLGLKF